MVNCWNVHPDGFSGTFLYYSLMEKNLKMTSDSSICPQWQAAHKIDNVDA
jgi:hypothetical protein